MFNKIGLDFDLDSFPSFMGKDTIDFHYNKHHQTYLDKLNQAVQKRSDLGQISLDYLLLNLDKIEEKDRQIVYNNGFQVLNHNLFWDSISPKKSDPDEELVNLAINKFGSWDEMKAIFNQKALNCFGSGWVFISLNKRKELEIETFSNTGNPIQNQNHPLLVIDIWEHAYYLDYQNRRLDFIENFWKYIDWDKVNRRFLEAKDY